MVGNSGSGKSTASRTLAGHLGVPWLELDSIFHQAGWQPRATEEFRAEVEEFAARDAWVVDGNYSAVRDLVWARADTVIWIDLPRRTVMWQLVRRTFRRMATGAELWNGNREQWRYLFSRDESILWWAWTNHRRYRDSYQRAATDPAHAHLRFVRVTSRAQLSRVHLA
ncbi:MAG: adenylate kinase [Thermoactinospora sp.]|nr:adenylate kinase [Thermoactinospora sp.]